MLFHSLSGLIVASTIPFQLVSVVERERFRGPAVDLVGSPHMICGWM